MRSQRAACVLPKAASRTQSAAITRGYADRTLPTPPRMGIQPSRSRSPCGDGGRPAHLGRHHVKCRHTTGLVGKRHLGQAGVHHPLARGFQDSFGVLAGRSTFINPRLEGAESIGALADKRSARFGVYRGRGLSEVTRYLRRVHRRGSGIHRAVRRQAVLPVSEPHHAAYTIASHRFATSMMRDDTCTPLWPVRWMSASVGSFLFSRDPASSTIR